VSLCFYPSSRIEKAALAAQCRTLYIASMSCLVDHLQGHDAGARMSANLISRPDGRIALNPRLRLSPSVNFHHYSTVVGWRTFRCWPTRREINKLKAQHNWMKRTNENRMASGTVGENGAKTKSNRSSRLRVVDSCRVDRCFEVLVPRGRITPMAKTMLVPETGQASVELPQAWARQSIPLQLP